MKLFFSFLLFFITSELTSGLDDWPEFWGPQQNGHVKTKDLPLNWGPDKNIRWKTSIHDRGWSSPVIFDSQIWVTTATRDGKKLFAVCVDLNSGTLIHDTLVFTVDTPQKIAAENSYATPTSAIDKTNVYVHYGTYGTACIDRKTGMIVWTRRDLKCDHENGAGPASSPMLFKDLLIVNVDGRDYQYVIALDKSSGKTVWKTNRSVDFTKVPVNQRKAYSMPTLFSLNGKLQLVSNGGKGIYSYDPATGKEIWRVQHHGFSQAPRPVFGEGRVYATVDRDNPELWAFNANGKGDVSKSNVLWKEKKGMPRRSSPLMINSLLYLFSHNGVATCLDAKSGRLIWKERLKGSFSASPLYAADRIYVFNDDAVTYVLEPGREFKVIATNNLDKDNLRATPAVSKNSLILRTEKSLYRIDTQSK